MSMARLIDADALFRRTSKEMDCSKLYLPVDFQELVATEPTMDAEPVRHGRWIEEHCSECDKYVYVGDVDDYCPHCGAKMDGGEEQLRLIDADALKDCFCKGPTELIYTHVVLGIIDDAPTVDAKPVKTAQLIRETDRERHWHCSRCGKVFGLVGLMHKYCPECGARLIGVGGGAE